MSQFTSNNKPNLGVVYRAITNTARRKVILVRTLLGDNPYEERFSAVDIPVSDLPKVIKLLEGQMLINDSEEVEFDDLKIGAYVYVYSPKDVSLCSRVQVVEKYQDYFMALVISNGQKSQYPIGFSREHQVKYYTKPGWSLL